MTKFNITNKLINTDDNNHQVHVQSISNDALNAFKENFLVQTINQFKSNKYHAVMLYYTEGELGISNNYGKWINTRNVYFTDGAAALNYYSNTKCPASQLVSADSIEELLQEINTMIENFNNKQWLDKNLYPYL